MENLGQIATVNAKIKTAPKKVIQALHVLIFGEEGDRNNRKRLREFSGFTFSDGSAEYKKKCDFAFTRLTDGDMISICNILNLDYTGTKDILIKRICGSLLNINELAKVSQGDEDENSESEGDTTVIQSHNENTEEKTDSYSDEDSKSNCSSNRKSTTRKRFAIGYGDVENSIRDFDGKDGYPVEKWISDFEDMAVLYDWDDLLKLVFAKRSLTGVAKLFVQSEKTIKSWKKLKEALKQEFSTKVNSAQLHEELKKRKMRREETPHEYYLIMKELASRGNIEAAALMRHVIKGIWDDESNKTILYGAKNLSEFKDRLEIYTEMRQNRLENDRRDVGSTYKKKDSTYGKNNSSYGKKDTSLAGRKTGTTKKTEVNENTAVLRCFGCGEKGHRLNDCGARARGFKCFSCNEFGHKANACPRTKVTDEQSRSGMVNIISSTSDKTYKNIVINGILIRCLIDTGSRATLIRQDLYKEIGAPACEEVSVVMTGFGQRQVETLGNFLIKTQIDGDDFELNVYIVPNDSMPMAMIIGSDILEQAELTINQDGAILSKFANQIFLTEINVASDTTVNVDSNAKKSTVERVKVLVESYKPNKIKTTGIELKIALKNEQPISHRPYRLPLPEREIVDKQIEEWIKDGIIEPSSSEYASPVVVVKKKNGTPRVCIDYRKLNSLVIKDRFPLPLIEDQLDHLQDARVFTTLDLKNGFFHVSVEEESRKYTAFITHAGQFQFLKAPFGFCNSPSVFQRFINSIFRPLTNQGIVFTYMDDLIIPAADEEEGLLRLQTVLQTASDYGLQINFSKCQFMRRRIEFLGHMIEAGKIYPSEDKTAAVLRFPTPTSNKHVQSFLGLSGYFRKFIPHYSLIAKPLTDLLRKDQSFKFDEKEMNAFNQLKQMLSTKPVLKIYNTKDETELHTDASIEGYGAVLLQRSQDDGQLHPIYYMSHKTKPAERNYSSYELEVLAVIEALKKFRVYLLGIRFKIVTDCSAFERTLHKKDLTTRVARWVLLLEEFDYVIEHRPGVRMKHADALSRYPVMVIDIINITSRVKRAQDEDKETCLIKELLQEKEYDDYFLRNEILYKFKDGRDLLVIPKSMQNEIIKLAHEKGHFGVKRTLEAIDQDYFIPDLKKKIEKHIANCIPCILANRKEGKQEGLLHPIDKQSTPLFTFHMDHLGPLTSTHKNYNHILVIVDSFTKYVWLYPTKSTTTKEVLDRLESQKKNFGSPAQIITDRGTAFTSREFAEYCESEGIKHLLVTTGLPRANGQVERINRTIIPILTKLSIEDPTKWYKHVERLQRVINSTYQRSIDNTPFELLFGVKMRDKVDFNLKELIEEEFRNSFQKERENARIEAKEQILKVQSENRKTYNLRRRNATKYKVGDLVAVRRTQLGPGLKLKTKYLGPYKITKVKNNDTYDVERSGACEGPFTTTTCSQYLKPWVPYEELSETDN